MDITFTKGAATHSIGFTGVTPERMFGALSRPRASVQTGVVICPSILTDLLSGYRAEVLLADALASRSINTMRFHYRGTGHSEGDSALIDFDTMLVDALRAADVLERTCGVRRIAFAGSRIGAIVAAAAAQRTARPVVLAWEPVLDPTVFFRSAIRMRFMREVVANGRSHHTTRQLFAQLMAGDDSVDVLGYPLTPRLYRSLHSRLFLDQFDRGTGSTLLMGLSSTDRYLQALEAAAARLRNAGHNATVAGVATTTNWWLAGSSAEPSRDQVECSADWLSEGLAAERSVLCTR